MVELQILAEAFICTQRSFRYEYHQTDGPTTAAKRVAVAALGLRKTGSAFNRGASIGAVSRRRDRRLNDFRFRLPVAVRNLEKRFSFQGAAGHISRFQRLVESPEATRLFRCIQCRRFGIAGSNRTEPQLFCSAPAKCKTLFQGDRRKDAGDLRTATTRYHAAHQARGTLTEWSRKALKHLLGRQYTCERRLNLRIIFGVVSDAERGDPDARSWLVDEDPAGDFAFFLGLLDDAESVKRVVQKLLEMQEREAS